MQCPDCDKPLQPRTLAGQRVDECAVCGGLWFDEDELSRALRNELIDEETERPRREPSTTSDAPQVPLACPRCKHKLRSTNYAHDSGIFVHNCGNCQGAWLRANDLPRLARYRRGTKAQRSLANALVDEVRTVQKQDRIRALLRSRWACSIAAVALLIAIFQIPPLPNSRFRIAFPSTGMLLCLTVVAWARIWFSPAQGLDFHRHRAPTFGISRPSRADIAALLGWGIMLCVAGVTLHRLMG